MTTKIIKRLPTFATDADGDAIAIVPLANGGAATLDLADWEELLCRGLTPNWTFNSSGNGYAYVRTEGADNLVVVARVIMGAGRGEVVRYRSDSRTDLRRKNLYVTGGGRAKGVVRV